MEQPTPCVFYQGKKCLALTRKFCYNCAFYKTPEQLQSGRDKVERRIKRLPRNIKATILGKYRRIPESEELNEGKGT